VCENRVSEMARDRGKLSNPFSSLHKRTRIQRCESRLGTKRVCLNNRALEYSRGLGRAGGGGRGGGVMMDDCVGRGFWTSCLNFCPLISVRACGSGVAPAKRTKKKRLFSRGSNQPPVYDHGAWGLNSWNCYTSWVPWGS